MSKAQLVPASLKPIHPSRPRARRTGDFPHLLLSAVLVLSLHAAARHDRADGGNPLQATAKPIQVPAAKGNPVSTDGSFSPGEWDDALKLSLSEGYMLLLKADSGSLYVGLKSSAPIGDAVVEIFLAKNENEFFTLHSSAALAEGVNRFGTGSKYEVGKHEDWEANTSQPNKDKVEKWIADGRPSSPERFAELGKEKEGLEYRIGLKKFPGKRIKMMIGAMCIKRGFKENIRYPQNANLSKSDQWADLILPESPR